MRSDDASQGFFKDWSMVGCQGPAQEHRETAEKKKKKRENCWVRQDGSSRVLANECSPSSQRKQWHLISSHAGVKNIHPVNDCARLGRIVSSSSSPPKTLLSISLSLFCGLILVWFSFWCKMVVVWQPEMIVFHQPGRIYSWLAIFGPFLTMTRHDSSSLNVLPLFLSFNAGRDT